jgi:hypothetical protein
MSPNNVKAGDFFVVYRGERLLPRIIFEIGVAPEGFWSLERSS